MQFAVGEKVLAAWGRKFLPAVINEVLKSGYYHVIFTEDSYKHGPIKHSDLKRVSPLEPDSTQQEHEITHEEQKITQDQEEIRHEDQEISQEEIRHEEQEITQDQEEIRHEDQEISQEEIRHEEQEITQDQEEIRHEDQEISQEEIRHEEQEITQDQEQIRHEDQEISQEEIRHEEQEITQDQEQIRHEDQEISQEEIRHEEQEITQDQEEIRHEDQEISQEEIRHEEQEITQDQEQIRHEDQEISQEEIRHEEQEITQDQEQIRHEDQEISQEEIRHEEQEITQDQEEIRHEDQEISQEEIRHEEQEITQDQEQIRHEDQEISQEEIRHEEQEITQDQEQIRHEDQETSQEEIRHEEQEITQDQEQIRHEDQEISQEEIRHEEQEITQDQEEIRHEDQEISQEEIRHETPSDPVAVEEEAMSDAAKIQPPSNTIYELLASGNKKLVLFTATLFKKSGTVHCIPLKETENCYLIKSVFLNRIPKCKSFTYDQDLHSVGTTIAWPIINTRIKKIRVCNKKPEQLKRKVTSQSDGETVPSKSISKTSSSSRPRTKYNDNDFIDLFWGAHQIATGYYCPNDDPNDDKVDCFEIQVRLEYVYKDNFKYVANKVKQKTIVVGQLCVWPIIETQLHSETSIQLKSKRKSKQTDRQSASEKRAIKRLKMTTFDDPIQQCQCKRLQCSGKVTPDEQMAIREAFWNIEGYTEKNLYLANLLEKEEKSRATTLNVNYDSKKRGTGHTM